MISRVRQRPRCDSPSRRDKVSSHRAKDRFGISGSAPTRREILGYARNIMRLIRRRMRPRVSGRDATLRPRSTMLPNYASRRNATLPGETKRHTSSSSSGGGDANENAKNVVSRRFGDFHMKRVIKDVSALSPTT